MSLLANAWSSQGVDVSLVTIAPMGSDTYFLDPAVQRIGLDCERPSGNAVVAAYNNLQRIRRLRARVRELRPDALISFMTATNVLTVLAAMPLKLPVIVSERVAPETVHIGKFWSQLRKYAYRRAAAVVAQTSHTAEWLRSEVPGANVEVVANPVQVESGQAADSAAQTVLTACGGHNVVLAAGRLTRQKGFDLLLRAFATLARRHPGWRLAILGDGPEGEALRELSRVLGIADRVLFPGFSRSLHRMMQESELFVLSSRFEGMPNVLAEAMACGMACVSFDCPAGPAEIVSHGHNGVLVPAEDVANLTLAMDRLMGDEALRRRMGGAARNSLGSYSMENILEHWNALLARVLAAAGPDGVRGISDSIVERRT
jgi:GalNAc-alpha-(1->4)-GalNAc-alpha-(1->3)-diNAcBac-PP-undecaprenol alpha-1,4-N-acetyl-D-galactosaminyltransferase